LVLFLDDDVVAAPGLVSSHLCMHEEAADPRLGILGLVDWDPVLRVTAFMRWLDGSGLQFAYRTWLREGPVEPPFAAFYTANLSLPRWLLAAAGGFDERFPHANFEDIELAWRLTKLGFRLQYRATAVAYHSRPIDLPAFCVRMANEAESAAVLRAIQPQFPLDEEGRVGPYVRRRKRLLLRAAAPLAAGTGWTRLLARYYRAEIAAAYLQGRRRGEEQLGRRMTRSAGTDAVARHDPASAGGEVVLQEGAEPGK
jgi:hypothetical protein